MSRTSPTAQTLEEQISGLRSELKKLSRFNSWLLHNSQRLLTDNRSLFTTMQQLDFELNWRIASLPQDTQGLLAGYRRLEAETTQQKSTIRNLREHIAQLEEKIADQDRQLKTSADENYLRMQRIVELREQLNVSLEPENLETQQRTQDWVDSLLKPTAEEPAPQTASSVCSVCSAQSSSFFANRTQPNHNAADLSHRPGVAKL